MNIKKSITVSVLIALFALNGCSNETTSSGALDSSQENGEVIIGLTDAPGDFHSYTVDVSSLTLTRCDGTVVETLPVTTRVDFSQYVDLTEFLTAATVPAGNYVKGELSVDYKNADIRVEDELGNTISVNTLVDSDGQPVSSMDLSVNLENQDMLKIAPGIPAHLTLDFDLNASHSVTFNEAGEAEVTIEPILIAEIDAKRAKSHRARGGLKSVELASSSYEIVLRPFFHRFSNDQQFGTLTIITDSDTHYDINGQLYSGEDGLAELALQPALTATVASGKFKRNPLRFVADSVYAGSSVPGGDLDVVKGSVIARSQNTLSIQGATLIRDNGSAVFNDLVTVALDDNTRVTKQYSVDEMSIKDISVGQKVSVHGELVNRQSGSLELDASTGHVRMLISYLKGRITETGDDLNLNLDTINQRDIRLFEFSGTGVNAESDADPQDYEVYYGELDTQSLAGGDPIKVAGHVKTFGTAPADFSAITLADFSDLPALMQINWTPASENALDFSVTGQMEIDLTDSGRFHHISQAGERLDLTELEAPVVITAVDKDRGPYTIIQNQTRQVHSEFNRYVEDLEHRFDTGALLKRLYAHGNYDFSANQLSAEKITIYLR